MEFRGPPEYFKQELHARERCSSASVKTAEKQILDESTTSSFVVRHDNISCVYCLGQHASSKCTKITSVKAKRDLLRKFTRCFVCLKKGHVSKNCDSKYKCNKCSSRHHISICGIFEEKTAVNGSTNKKCILLQTANAQISARESNSSGLARIFFETGSQRSYVTNDTHNRLNLLIIRKEKLVIQTFGQHESKLENDIV